MIERDPIQLAKEIASLDMISNGRVILGIGACWNREVEDCNLTLFGAAADEDKIRFRISQGCDELVFGLPSSDADTVLPMLDKLAELVKTVKAG